MKNYKAEIKYLVEEARLTNPEYDGVLKITDEILSLFREIVKEAVVEDRQVVYYGDFVGHAKEAMQSLVNKGYNERGSEILSNVEEMIK